jgi:hypothetical protein
MTSPEVAVTVLLMAMNNVMETHYPFHPVLYSAVMAA